MLESIMKDWRDRSNLQMEYTGLGMFKERAVVIVNNWRCVCSTLILVIVCASCALHVCVCIWGFRLDGTSRLLEAIVVP